MLKFRRFFLASGILMLASELWKQYTLTFLLGGGNYNWWYFPFQLCSIPMYVCLLLPWVRSRCVQQVLTAFLVDFGMLGGIFAFFDTSGMHYDYFPLTVHSFAWHILLIILGLAAARSDQAASSWDLWPTARDVSSAPTPPVAMPSLQEPSGAGQLRYLVFPHVV